MTTRWVSCFLCLTVSHISCLAESRFILSHLTMSFYVSCCLISCVSLRLVFIVSCTPHASRCISVFVSLGFIVTHCVFFLIKPSCICIVINPIASHCITLCFFLSLHLAVSSLVVSRCVCFSLCCVASPCVSVVCICSKHRGF